MIANLLKNISAYKNPYGATSGAAATTAYKAPTVYNPTVTIPVAAPAPTTGDTFGAAPAAAAPSASATPAAPAAPYQGVDFSNLGHDSIYDANVARLNANRANADTALTATLAKGSQTYGYAVDPSGAVTEDVSNPYSRRQLLIQAYENARRGNTTSAAASGHLYAGSLNNAQDWSQRTNDISSDALKRSFLDFVTNAKGARAKAEDAYSQGLTQAEADNISRWISEHPPTDAPVPAVPPEQDPYAIAIVQALAQQQADATNDPYAQAIYRALVNPPTTKTTTKTGTR